MRIEIISGLHENSISSAPWWSVRTAYLETEEQGKEKGKGKGKKVVMQEPVEEKCVWGSRSSRKKK